jgi:hypothetical protein
MHPPDILRLQFSDEVPRVVRARISYALRIFAAIYGYSVADEATCGARGAVCCFYGKQRPKDIPPETLFVPARYEIGRSKHGTQKLSKHRYAREDLYLAYGIDEASGNPDWLGEMFEWLSCSHEMGIVRRDIVGRVPYSEMIFGRQGISPRKPYASILMSWMENALRNGNSRQELLKARSPLPGGEHIVVCSHDIDFYYQTWSTALLRLVKNLGISYHPYRSWSYFRANSRMIFDLFGGKQVGAYLPQLLEASTENGFSATLFVAPGRGHRRDPNYQLKNLALQLSEASKKGFPAGLHGSYTSVIEAAELSSEAAALQKVTGKKPLGNRQHWLRFDQHEKLFRCIEEAELSFDSTLGFADTVGFRNGASFAFPPYDFAHERPYQFLEIPLVLMDGNLEAASRSLQKDPQELADEVLRESRKWGWGGIAALWHNPIEPLSVPIEINRVFWKCVKAQHEFQEIWSSGEDFLEACLFRYHSAGLLKGVRFDA